MGATALTIDSHVIHDVATIPATICSFTSLIIIGFLGVSIPVREIIIPPLFDPNRVEINGRSVAV